MTVTSPADADFGMISFQKLLQLQYENTPVVTYFGKVKMNVEPLIALLNKKFFIKVK